MEHTFGSNVCLVRGFRRIKNAQFMQLAVASYSGPESVRSEMFHAKIPGARVAGRGSPVLSVRDVNNIPKILNAVVAANTVQMVNLASGPCAVVHEPNDAMSAYGFAARLDNGIPAIIEVSGHSTGNSVFASERFLPTKDAVVIPEYGVRIAQVDPLSFGVSVGLLLGCNLQVLYAVVGTLAISVDHQTIRPAPVVSQPRQMMGPP